jgi:hypothetical protein
VEGALLSLQGSGFAAAMRSSLWLYPAANVVHILALLVFFASVAAMDVAVLRAKTTAAARAFVARVRPVAIGAFLVQVASGVMLLAPEASHIAMNPVFRIKLFVIAVGLLNVILLEVMVRRNSGEAVGGGSRASAGASIVLWLSAAALGRLIAYF